ncbi:hypothetical protein EYF80_004119 [Liparis tanakae]|uniref:Uncharacterized protein n=1 Tax=Liparis tanakae TaxID=230148 RepID=A0A4Z2J5L9_9TELE|nr:hypothetical protein EYF80_004119 [Liparis tanakae]
MLANQLVLFGVQCHFKDASARGRPALAAEPHAYSQHQQCDKLRTLQFQSQSTSLASLNPKYPPPPVTTTFPVEAPRARAASSPTLDTAHSGLPNPVAMAPRTVWRTQISCVTDADSSQTSVWEETSLHPQLGVYLPPTDSSIPRGAKDFKNYSAPSCVCVCVCVCVSFTGLERSILRPSLMHGPDLQALGLDGFK